MRMGNYDIKAVIELLGSFEFVLILCLTVSEDVEILPEGVDLIDRI